MYQFEMCERELEQQRNQTTNKNSVGFSSLFNRWLSKTMPKNTSYGGKKNEDGEDLEFDKTQH